jgi:DNA polymerase III alpha subunit
MNNYTMRSNRNHQMILNEDDLISAWLGGSTISSAIFEDDSPINIYNGWCQHYDLDTLVQPLTEDSSDDYTEKCLKNWNMPESYQKLNIAEYLINQTSSPVEQQRVIYELTLYQERGMLVVLQFLKYLADVCQENKIVLGVGRGSSVASYCLYLLGIHKINSIEYDLDIKEFLK